MEEALNEINQVYAIPNLLIASLVGFSLAQIAFEEADTFGLGIFSCGLSIILLLAVIGKLVKRG